MSTNPGKSPKELQSSWMVLRLAIRNAASGYAPRLLEKTNAFGGQPLDPAQVQLVVRKLNEELEHAAAEGEASPALRLVKKIFKPNDAEKERRNLEKAFNTYLQNWNAQHAG